MVQRQAWDVTVPDTYAESHIGDTATEAGAAAYKISEHDELASTHILYLVTIETGGTWNLWAVELVQEIGRRAILITGDWRIQRIHLSVSAVVNSSPFKGKCGRLPQQL